MDDSEAGADISNLNEETSSPPRSVGDVVLKRYRLTCLLGENDLGWVFAAQKNAKNATPLSAAITLLRPDHACENASVLNSMSYKRMVIAAHR